MNVSDRHGSYHSCAICSKVCSMVKCQWINFWFTKIYSKSHFGLNFNPAIYQRLCKLYSANIVWALLNHFMPYSRNANISRRISKMYLWKCCMLYPSTSMPNFRSVTLIKKELPEFFPLWLYETVVLPYQWIIHIQLFLWPPCIADVDIIFLPCSLFYISSFFPHLISAVVDWMSAILPHMVWP